MSEHTPSPKTIYHHIGGADTLRQLVHSFYDRVGKHPDLAPIFPDDLTETAEKQFKFLSQYFGGPPLYSQAYGHPMLRARHLPFPITPTRAKAWLSCMQASIQELEIEPDLKDFMLERLTLTAQHMVNTPEEDESC